MIEPISLSLSPIKLNEKLTVTGFGRFDSSGEMSKFLKKLDGQVVECSKPNLAVCVAYYPGNGTCKVNHQAFFISKFYHGNLVNWIW